jgi:hypothetical protein
MSIQPHEDLLTVLRSNLRRIEEEQRDDDLTPNARELKQLLLHRIAIIEAAMENLKKIAGLDTVQKPVDSPKEI